MKKPVLLIAIILLGGWALFSGNKIRIPTNGTKATFYFDKRTAKASSHDLLDAKDKDVVANRVVVNTGVIAGFGTTWVEHYRQITDFKIPVTSQEALLASPGLDMFIQGVPAYPYATEFLIPRDRSIMTNLFCEKEQVVPTSCYHTEKPFESGPAYTAVSTGMDKNGRIVYQSPPCGGKTVEYHRARCRGETSYKGLNITYEFAGEHLAEWQDIQAKTFALIDNSI